MTATDTEKMAVLKVREEILRNSDCLSEYINSNDKTPMWDGDIYVYNNSKKENKHYEGKIETQVKGEKVEKIKKGNSKYRIKIEALEAYKKDKKGTLLLVCKYIDIDNYQLYYANLLPIDLDEILTRAKNKNKSGKDEISVDIKPITRNSISSLKTICLNFLRESNRQLNIKIMDIKEIKNIKKIGFQITGIKNHEEMIDYMLNNDIYSYATVGDNNEVVALKKSKLCQVGSIIKHKVYVNNKLYYDKFSILYSKEKDVFKFGKGVLWGKSEVNVKVEGNLYDRINDIEFFLNVLKYKKIKIDDKEYIAEFDCTSEDKKENSGLEEYLEWLIKVKNTFEIFKIKFDVDFNVLNDNDIRNINVLIDICNGNYKKYVKSFNQLFYTEIYNHKIVYILREIENGIEVIDFYSDLNNIIKSVVYIGKDKQEVILSPYIQFKKNDLLEHLNFKCEIVKRSFENIDIRVEKIIIEFALECILAYDEDNSRKDLLDLALYITNKLVEKNPSNPINIINNLQIIKRMRNLNEDEIEKVICIRENEKDTQIQLAISILLESNIEFNNYYNILTDDEKNVFNRYPIYNLKLKH